MASLLQSTRPGKRVRRRMGVATARRLSAYRKHHGVRSSSQSGGLAERAASHKKPLRAKHTQPTSPERRCSPWFGCGDSAGGNAAFAFMAERIPSGIGMPRSRHAAAHPPLFLRSPIFFPLLMICSRSRSKHAFQRALAMGM